MDENEKTTNDPIPVPGMSADEAKRTEKSALMSLVANIVESERNTWMKDVVDELKEFTDPDRSNVPEIQNTRGETVHRLSSPADTVYRRMSPEMRAVRNPDSDHWMAEWIRGQYNKDRARMFVATEHLNAMFRAVSDIVEDPVGPSGGISATASGGPLLPRPLESVVMIERDRVAKMRRWATIYQMTAQQHNIPTAGSMVAYMAGENTTSTSGEPTFAYVSLVAKKGRCLAVATQEILNDAAVNLVNLFAVRAGGALGKLEDDQFFELGDGTGNNISADISGNAFTATPSATTMAYSNVVGMYFAVPQQYRDNARWLIAGNILEKFSSLQDGNGRPFYQGLQERPLTLGDDPWAVGTILGKPVYEVPLPNGEIFFGDVAAAYAVGSRQGIQSAASEHFKFDVDAIMWKFTQRFDGVNIDQSASAHATGITAVSS
jgi:HK97 family phage major capsid protein